MLCLGIDIGSTSVKGAVLDLERCTAGPPIFRPFPPPLPGLPPRWIEIDPAAIVLAAVEVIEELLREAPHAERVYCSCQMGGVILVEDNGRPLTNYLSWRDQRSLDPVATGRSLLESIRVKWEDADVMESLGRELKPGSTTALLAWLRQHDRLPTGGVPQTVGDFVFARLLGSPVSMHVTHAIGLADLRTTGAWHEQALEMIGLGDVQWPKLSDREEAIGEAVVAGRKLELFGSYGDQQTALRGAGLARNELSLNISTGSQVSRRTARFEPGPYQSRRYFFGDYLNTITHLPAGRSLNVLVDLLTELARAEGRELTNPWQAILQAAAAAPESELKVDLAFFEGPLGSQGSITGITTENLAAGQLFRAAFRAMADNYAEVAARFGPADFSSVVLSGGLTQSAPLLREYLARCFPQPLRESAGEETLAGLLDIALARQ